MVFSHGARIPGYRSKKTLIIKKKSNNFSIIDTPSVKDKSLEPEVIVVEDNNIIVEDLKTEPNFIIKEFVENFTDSTSLKDAVVEKYLIEDDLEDSYDSVELEDILTDKELEKEIIEKPKKKKRKYSKRKKK